MLFLILILFSIGNIFCSSSLNDHKFNVVPIQKIGINDSIIIKSYYEDIIILPENNQHFDVSLSRENLKIKCLQNFNGYSNIDLLIDGEEVNLIFASLSNDTKAFQTHFLKDNFEFKENHLILNYKSLSKFNLKSNKFWILFNNQIIDSKYYHIFRDRIRIMIPNSLGDGLLRILSVDEHDNFIKENHTLISNGRPLSPSYHNDSPYFTNIYHIIIDRFNDADSTNSIHKQDYTVDKQNRFHGGDFKGIEEKIRNGYFDKLGVKGILLSPVCLNQDSAYRKVSIPYEKYMPFDGGMPVDSKEIDYRYGTQNDFKTLVDSGHKKGMKFYIEYINTYTGTNHNYYINNPEWYINNDSLLNNFFIQNLDYTNTDFINQISSDLSFLINEYSLDGFSIMDHNHLSNFKRRMEQIQSNSILQIIESDRLSMPAISSNKSHYNSYHNTGLYEFSREHFSGQNINFIHLNNLINESLDYHKPMNLIINPTSIESDRRFITLTKDQHDFKSGLITNKIIYDRLAMFTLMNYSLPGIPFIFYGEEFGHQGSYHQDSKRDMKFHESLDNLEKDLKQRVSALARIRDKYPSLSIGDFMVLRDGVDYTAWLKSYFNEQILILFNMSEEEKEINIPLPSYTKQLTSLLDEHHIDLKGSNMLRVLVPPHTSSIYLLNTVK